MESDTRRLLAQLAVAVIAADGRVTSSELEAVARLDDLGLGRLSTLAGVPRVPQHSGASTSAPPVDCCANGSLRPPRARGPQARRADRRL